MPKSAAQPEPITRAIVLAAGLGTRLLPTTRSVPKEMLPIGRRPVLEYVCDELGQAGVRNLTVVLSPEKTAVRSYFGETNAQFPGLTFAYAEQPPVNGKPKGTADAIRLCRDHTGDETFVVALGDALLVNAQGGGAARLLDRMMEAHRAFDADMTVGVRRVPLESISRYGVVKPRGDALDEGFLIDDIIEKPPMEKAPSEFAVTARYVFSPCVYDYIERTGPDAAGEQQITNSIRLCVRTGGRVCCVPLLDGEVRYDVGEFQGYFKTFIAFALSDPEHGEAVARFAAERLGV
jgi:UTP--glucose-1-phosphate uridylyltransferase